MKLFWDKLSKIGGQLLVKPLEHIENGTAPRIPQSDDFTMAPMLDKEMSKRNSYQGIKYQKNNTKKYQTCLT